MFVTYPDACWCQLISPSITGLRHYRSGCVSIPCAGPPTSAATRPTTHARAGPTPHRRFHKLCRASNRAATTHISSCLPHARLKPGQNSPCMRKTAQIPCFWTSRGNFVTDITRGSSTGHVLSDHKLYARTFTHWLTRPPATPSMGGRHTRGQRGLAAVPEGGGGISIPQRSPT